MTQIMSQNNPNAFKNRIDAQLLKRIGSAIQKEYPEFGRQKLNSLEKKLKPLELKPRIKCIRDELKRLLPADYLESLRILVASTDSGTLNGFDLWPYTEFIQTFGLDHPVESLNALKKLTPLFTSEFAVRPFLISHPKKTLDHLMKCTSDPHPHVRRWVSEGTRSRLPWGEKLAPFIQDPSPSLKLIEKLKYDSDLYVRKSVANHLNDLGKDHPQTLIKTLKEWNQNIPIEHVEKIKWITRHALRTLIKKGNSSALKLIGVESKAKIKISPLQLNPKVVFQGKSFNFVFQIQSQSEQQQKLVIDYLIYFQTSSSRLSPKVFKLKTFILNKKETKLITKNHSLKKITTRTYYPGKHKLEIQINGKIYASETWTLK